MNVHSGNERMKHDHEPEAVMSEIEALQQQIFDLRRAQILDAATQVFAEKGFPRATIKEIARIAQVADGTIYNYFENKEALLFAILDRLNETEQREAHFAAGVQGDLRTFIAAYLRRRMALLWPNAAVFKAILPELLVNTELREIYYQQIIAPSFRIAEQHFAAQMDAGILRRMDAPLTVRAIGGMVLGLLLLELLGDEHLQVAWEDAPDTLAALIYDGLKPGE
jgi:AcrR family transcriptional regulator